MLNGGRLYKVWYHRNPTFRQNDDIYWKDIPNTHAMVRFLEAKDLDEVYHEMQGENWSPEGEARSLIRMLGLQHTSMSVGDVIEDIESGAFYQVMRVGFEQF